MTIKEYYQIIVNKYNAAYNDYITNKNERLKGMLDAYYDIICEIAYNENFKLEIHNEQ